jgi:hypothetical protein
MPANLHDQGEELILSSAFSSRTVEIGLFDDSTDSLSDSATYSSITTEPSGSAYSVQSVTGPTVSQSSGTTEVDMGSLSFDVSDSSQTVDACYVRDQSSGDLILTNALDSSYDLSSIDTLDLSNVGMSLD